MKARFYITMAGLALGLAAAASGCAGPGRNNTEQYHYLTGSYAPQNVQRTGPVSNGQSNVRVLDQSDINRSGGVDVSQSLRQLGATH